MRLKQRATPIRPPTMCTGKRLTFLTVHQLPPRDGQVQREAARGPRWNTRIDDQGAVLPVRLQLGGCWTFSIFLYHVSQAGLSNILPRFPSFVHNKSHSPSTTRFLILPGDLAVCRQREDHSFRPQVMSERAFGRSSKLPRFGDGGNSNDSAWTAQGAARTTNNTPPATVHMLIHKPLCSS